MSKKINAEIVADSINSNGNRITTFLLTYPRFIHGEIMTHRVFSRNSASSRAIPFDKMVKDVQEDPFIPIAWQKDHKGMQGTEYFTNNDFEYGIYHRSMHNDSSHFDDHETWFYNEKKRDEIFEYWGKSNRGPGPNYWHEYSKKISRPLQNTFSQDWLNARDLAVSSAVILNNNNLTKQLCNRLLEPYMWHTVLVTATEYDNFFELRCPSYGGFDKNGVEASFKSKKDVRKHFESIGLKTDVVDNQDFYSWQSINKSQAEIHIQALAEIMWDTINESTPKLLEPGQWHIPFGDNISDDRVLEYLNSDGDGSYGQQDYDEIKIKVSVARCARLSYMTFDGEIDYEKDIKLHDQLLDSKHFSPFEHIAKCTKSVFFSDPDTSIEDGFTYVDMNQNLWSGNFKGWIQYRQLIS